jgi:hypothetical protein
MSYTITISGHVSSAKQEAEVLAKVTDLVEEIEANGTFSFHGVHLSIQASAPADAVAKARALLSEYASSADADDQVATEAKTESDLPDEPEEPEDTGYR